ncbi:MAG: response regulator transcription factor [Thermodesulfobacteriota bacterium]|nr:response regulator transcription factor [Thermodesulfobacteriota bacterium]
MNKVLIVEDNADFRQILCTALNKKIPDITLYEVSNGLEAIQKFDDLSPDIVLMDIALPVMNGLEAIKILKRTENPSWIVIITGNDIPEYVEAAKKSGADYFLSKNSIKLAEIISLVIDLLNCDDILSQKWERFRIL